MEIKFHGLPTPRGVCRITNGETLGGGGCVRGSQLKAEFKKAGRPETIQKVLIIDDDPTTLKTLRRMAGRLGVEIATFDPVEAKKDAAQTVAFANSNDFEMIVIDGRMKMLFGATLVEKLRAGGYAGYLVANSSFPEENERMIERGADFAIPDKNIYAFPDFFQPQP